MAKSILIDQFLVSLTIPAGLPPDADRRIRRTLQRRQFRIKLQRDVQAFVREHLALNRVHVTVRR